VAAPAAILSETTPTDCANRLSPFVQAHLVGIDSNLTEAAYARGRHADRLHADLEATITDTDLQASVTICSPTSRAIPPTIGRTTRSTLDRERVGPGWRELGGSLLAPAPLLPGDALALPAFTADAQVRVRAAPEPGAPTVTLALSGLGLASTLRISTDARGVVATLERTDGSRAEAAAPAPQVPALQPRLTANQRSWQLTTRHLPGTTVYATTQFSGRDGMPLGGLALTRRDGKASVRLGVRPSDVIDDVGSLAIVATNRDAQVVRFWQCRLRLRVGVGPRSMRCRPWSLANVVANYLDPEDVELVRAATPLSAVRQSLRSRVPTTRRAHVTRRRSRSTAHRLASAAPAVTPIALSPGAAALGRRALRPLLADVTGDHLPDFWTDDARGAAGVRTRIGTVFASGPAGLMAHEVVVPWLSAKVVTSDTDVSAIADLTGDGIGELVVDAGDDRLVVVPGTAAWRSDAAPITVPNPQAASTLTLDPQLPAPGAPLTSLRDSTGDGLAELAVTTHSGGWLTVPSEQLQAAGTVHIPAAVPLPPTSDLLRGWIAYGAPDGNPQLRIIGGQAYAVRALKIATPRSPDGLLQVVVRDAAGQAVRAPSTVRTPGNAILLDADPRSGDLLLWSSAAACDMDRYGDAPCHETILRVRADGTVRNSVRVRLWQTRLEASSARFLPDGPDADTDPEVALFTYPRALTVLPSSAVGAQTERRLPGTTIAALPRYSSEGSDLPRLWSLVDLDGARRLLISLPRRDGSARWIDQAARVGEVRWPAP
jgi:hypothetical protein